VDYKICTKCSQKLPLDAFRIKKRRPGQKCGYSSQCKICLNQQARDRYNQKNQIKSDKAQPKPNHKFCSDCKQELLLKYFHPCCKNPTKNWHYDSKCKKCKNESAKSKSEYIRPSSLTLEHQLIESKRKKVKNGKYKHGNKFINFTIGVDDVRKLIKDQTRNGILRCAALNTPLNNSLLLKPSIDRINNNKGYVPNNIRITSYLYNVARNKWHDVIVIKAMHGLYPAGTQSWDNFVKKDSRRKQSNTNDGIYNNPGRHRGIPINNYDIKQIITAQSQSGFLTCAATGLRLLNDPSSPLYPSIDRINPHGPYDNSNITIVAKFFNLGRNRAKWEDAIKAFKLVSKNYSNRLIYVSGKYFFEDELIDKEEICRSLLYNHETQIIRASKCDVKLIDNRLAKRFFDKYHYAGSISGSFNIAAMFSGEVVACMSFRRPSGINCQEDWELSRMARHNDIYIHGVWSKLWSWVCNEKIINGSIITFTDNRLFSGDVYEKLGFELSSKIKPAHYWWRDGIRYHRQTTRKPKSCEMTESEYMESQGYEKVMDLGKKKWITTI